MGRKIRSFSSNRELVIISVLSSILLLLSSSSYSSSFSVITQQIPIKNAYAQNATQGEDTEITVDWQRVKQLHEQAKELNESERYEEASDYIDQALEVIFPGPGETTVTLSEDDQYNLSVILFEQATSFFNLERYEEAVKNLESAVEMDPNDSTAYNNLGVALGELERYEEALEAFNKALELDPNNDLARENRDVAISNLNAANNNGVNRGEEQAEEQSPPLGEQDQQEGELSEPDKPQIPVF